MQDTLLTLLTTGFSIILTGLVGYIVARQQKRDAIRDQKEEERDRERNNRSDMLEKLLVEQQDLKEKVDVLAERQESLLDTQDKIKTGLKLSLQGELLACYRQYTHNGNVLTSDDYAHWLNTYNAYHDIGGNSFCERLHQAVSAMDISDEIKGE